MLKIQDMARSSTHTGAEAEEAEAEEEEGRTVSNLSPVDAKICDRLREQHSDETWDVIKPALEMLTSVKHRTPREFANNVSEMSNVVGNIWCQKENLTVVLKYNSCLIIPKGRTTRMQLE